MKIYTSKSKIIGPCGPCSFINLTGMNGSPELEIELAEIGRLKPFHASTYSAFIGWAKKYKKDLEIYTSSKKLNDKMFDLMFFYEKIPNELKEKYKKQAKKLFDKRNKRFLSKLNKLNDPIKKIDDLLKEGYRVAVLTSDYYLKKPRRPVSHWIVCFKRKGKNYYFMDSARGLTILSKSALLKGFKINKKDGFCPQLVAYKK